MTERQLQDAVLELAWRLRWLAYHTFDSRRSAEGFPDLVLVKPPRLIFAELKAEKGRTSPAQERWLDELRACTARLPVDSVDVHLWRPADWKDGTIERVLLNR